MLAPIALLFVPTVVPAAVSTIVTQCHLQRAQRLGDCFTATTAVSIVPARMPRRRARKIDPDAHDHRPIHVVLLQNYFLFAYEFRLCKGLIKRTATVEFLRHSAFMLRRTRFKLWLSSTQLAKCSNTFSFSERGNRNRAALLAFPRGHDWQTVWKPWISLTTHKARRHSRAFAIGVAGDRKLMIPCRPGSRRTCRPCSTCRTRSPPW